MPGEMSIQGNSSPLVKICDLLTLLERYFKDESDEYGHSCQLFLEPDGEDAV